MKREDLEKLGLSEEQINDVMKLKGNSIKETETLQKEVDILKTDITNLNTQLNEANDTIKSYTDKEIDIEAIKKSAGEWEVKYNEEIESRKAEKQKEEYNKKVDSFFSDVKFASESAKAGVVSRFNEKQFKFDEESSKFQGASEWLEDLKKNDVGAFLSDVANPSFGTSISSPTASTTNDEIRKVMGLENKEK